jgi:beta-galactosidase
VRLRGGDPTTPAYGSLVATNEGVKSNRVGSVASLGSIRMLGIFGAIAVTVTAGCSQAPSSPDGSSFVVDAPLVHAGPSPLPFAFGTAIAGFQVDMGCPTLPAAQCADANSDWYQYITTDRLIKNRLLFEAGDPPSAGPGFYELYKDDIARAGGTGAGQLGSKVLRLSIEWSRIFPTSTVGVTGFDDLHAHADPSALAFYHAVFAELRSRGMRPSVTINHYTLPLWIHDGNLCNQDFNGCVAAHKAGWADPDRTRIVGEFGKYAGFLGKEFGGEVDEWATLNEPFSAVVVSGYLIATPARSSPPGLSGPWMNVTAAKTATLAMIEGHAAAYDALEANDLVDADGDGKAARVGIVYAFTQIDPLTGDARDAQAAVNADYFFHDMMLDGIAFGRVDANWDADFTDPTIRPARADLANRLDWLGVNYYFGFKAQSTLVTGLPFISPDIDFNMLQPFDTEDPSGLYRVLMHAGRFGVPLTVTETGYVQDDAHKAAAWTVATVRATQQAITDGADIHGYYTWSLMDNYEWNHGTGMRFGLYSVDPTTKARAQRESGRVFGQIIQAGGVTAELAATYATVFPQ